MPLPMIKPVIIFSRGLLSLVFLLPYITVFSFVHAQESGQSARFRALNKTVAQSTDIVLAPKEMVTFGWLDIQLHYCTITEDDQLALVEIWEREPVGLQPHKGGLQLETKQKRFSGWISAYHPALSGLTHPLYALTLVGCE